MPSTHTRTLTHARLHAHAFCTVKNRLFCNYTNTGSPRLLQSEVNGQQIPRRPFMKKRSFMTNLHTTIHAQLGSSRPPAVVHTLWKMIIFPSRLTNTSNCPASLKRERLNSGTRSTRLIRGSLRDASVTTLLF